MLEIIYAGVLIVLAAYAIGRTVGAESMFSDFRGRIQNGPYKKITDVNGKAHYPYPESGGNTDRTGKSWFYAQFQAYQIDVTSTVYDTGLDDEGEALPPVDVIESQIAIQSPNFYQPGFIGFLKGKLGDLLTCSTCLTGQSGLWLGVLWLFVGVSVIEYIVPLSIVGAGYIIITLLK